MNRPDWDTYFLNIAKTVSQRADCSRRQVGAIIVKKNRIVSTGYNGAPAGEKGCLAGFCPRANSDVKPNELPYTNCIAIHAEANALLYANRNAKKGATIYVTTKPCGDCEKLIKGAGILRVVYPNE